MKTTIFLIVILLCTLSICAAEERIRTGDQLLKDCKNAIDLLEGRNYDQVPAGYCSGYIDGIDNIVEFMDLAKERSKRSYCKPGIVRTRLLVMVVYKYLENHPEELDKADFLLVIKALKNAFPCK